MFKDDYIKATIPQAHEHVNLDLQSLTRVTERAEDHFGAQNISVIVYASAHLGVHTVYLRDEGAAYLDGQGGLVTRWEKNGRFEHWFLGLHYGLLNDAKGEVVVGLSGLAAALLIVTGLIAVWPMRRGLRRGLKVNAISRGQLRSFHRNLGVWAALPVFIIIITGVSMEFPKQARAAFGVLGVTPKPKIEAIQPEGVAHVNWQKVLRNAQSEFPDATMRLVIWPSGERPTSIRLKQSNEWHPNGRTVVALDPKDSRVLGSQDAMEFGRGERAYNSVYPIHAAGMGGRGYDLIVFLIGLALMLLSLAGGISFVRKWV